MPACPHDLSERESLVADGTCPICLMMEIDRLRDQNRQMRDAMQEMHTLVYIRTPAGMPAYTHFQRDFDRIRELTKRWIGGHQHV